MKPNLAATAAPPRHTPCRPAWHSNRTGWAIGLPLCLAGCTTRAAPTLILFGAYFPGWILCAVAGIFGAIAARAAMVVLHLSDVLPYQLFICAALGLVVAVALWVLWFGR